MNRPLLPKISPFCLFLLFFLGCSQEKPLPLSLLAEVLPVSMQRYQESDFTPSLQLTDIKRRLMEAGSNADISFYVESFELQKYSPASGNELLEGDWKTLESGIQVRERALVNGTSPFTEQLVFYQYDRFVVFASFHSPKGIKLEVWLPGLFRQIQAFEQK